VRSRTAEAAGLFSEEVERRVRARISSAELSVRDGFEARLSGLSAQLDHRGLLIEDLSRQLHQANALAAAVDQRDLRQEALAARLDILADDVTILNAERLVARRAAACPAPPPSGALAPGPASAPLAPPAPALHPLRHPAVQAALAARDAEILALRERLAAPLSPPQAPPPVEPLVAPPPEHPTSAAVAPLDHPDVLAALAARDRTIADRDARIAILEFRIRESLRQRSLDTQQFVWGFLHDARNEFALPPDRLGPLRRS
jgi:hypothetical protein